jgi:heat shock protein HtpX
MGANLRTVGLMVVLMGLFAIIGWLLGGVFFGDWVLGAIFFLVLAGIMNAISYFFSSKIVLWSYKAKIVTEQEAPRLYRIVREVAQEAQAPMPRVAIMPTATPNAFATGRNPENAVVAATQGILNLLSDRELKGVLAHEMAHVINRDILVMSVAATIAGAIAFMARFAFWGALFGGGRRDSGNWILLLVLAITAPIAAMLVQLAISRSREYKADRVGAILIRDPDSLANALQKLERGNRKRPLDYGNPASSSLFIVNPFSGGAFVRIFSTHPPVEKRVMILRKMAREGWTR